MPLPTQDCEISPDVCCSVVFDIANYLLDTVYDELRDCVPTCNGQLLPWARYVTMGLGDDGIGDSIAVAFQGCSSSPNSLDPTGKLNMVNSWRGIYDVRIRENGWPIIQTEGGKLSAPPPAMQHELARHAYSHGERMFRTLKALATNRMTAWLPNYPIPSYCSVADLRAINPQGGMVGFYSTVIVDLPFGIEGR